MQIIFAKTDLSTSFITDNVDDFLLVYSSKDLHKLSLKLDFSSIEYVRKIYNSKFVRIFSHLDNLFLIDKLSVSKSGGSFIAQVEAYDIRALLTQRVVNAWADLTGSPQANIKAVIESTCLQSGARSLLDIFEPTVKIVGNEGVQITEQFFGQNVWDIVKKFEEREKWRLFSEHQPSGKYQLTLEAVEDNGVLVSDIVKTSVSLGFVANSDEITSAFCAGEKQGNSNARQVVEFTNGATGLDRVEAYVDGGSNTSQNGSKLTSAQYTAVLEQKARDVIKDPTESVDINISQKVCRRLNVGDVVRVQSELNPVGAIIRKQVETISITINNGQLVYNIATK